MEHQYNSGSDGTRQALRNRIDELIERLRAGDVEAVRDSMYNRRWRDKIEATAVDSGKLGYADNLIDEAHTILRQAPSNTAAAIEKLERARGRLL